MITRTNCDPVDHDLRWVPVAPCGPDLTGPMSDSPPDQSPRRWSASRLNTPTVAGIVAGVTLYLVVIVSGNLLLGAGIALVLLLLVSLIRTVRQTRETRVRLREGQAGREDQR